jgi:hypothetical protein
VYALIAIAGNITGKRTGKIMNAKNAVNAKVYVPKQ